MRQLVGSGDRIALVALPFALVGVTLNVAFPSVFEVGGPAAGLRLVALAGLALGLLGWAWSVALILKHVPSGELITSGPFRVVKHPLYTSVAVLVLPSLGFLLDTWLGAVVGLALYAGSRRFAPEEEASLARSFGPAWHDYCDGVWLPWL